MPLVCGKALLDLTFLYAVRWLDRAFTPLDCGATPSLLGDTSSMGWSVILLHAMGGLPDGGLTYSCLGGMLFARVASELGGLPWLVWSDSPVTASLSHG